LERALDHVEQVGAVGAVDLLAAAHRRHLALDVHPPRPVQAHDVEVVKRLLLDDEGLALPGHHVVEDGQRLGNGLELGCGHCV
jgi:hypothetical protein